MKITAFLMLLSSFAFLPTTTARASCASFTIDTKDETWTFSAAAGGSQTRTLTITNISGAELALIIATGSDAFTVDLTSFTLPAMGDSGRYSTSTLTITFKPGANATGTLTGKLTISKKNSDCVTSLGLTGTVTTASGGDHVVILDPHSYDYGVTALGTDNCHEFSLVNKTGGAVTINSIKILGSEAFTLSTPFNGGSLDAGGTFTFKICFNSKLASMKYLDSILVVVSYGGAEHTLYGVISASTDAVHTAVPITADPHEFNFGTVDFGTSKCKEIVVTNTSKSDVILRKWNTCDNTDFTVTPGPTDGGDTLAIGASMTFTVCYKPHEAGITGTCAIEISYIGLDPLNDGILRIPISGSATTTTTEHACLHTEQGANFQDAIVVGTTAEHTLYLYNKSNFAITVTKAVITGEAAGMFTITSALPMTIPANTTTSYLTYNFTPSSNNVSGYKAVVTLSLSGDSLYCETATGVLIGFVVQSHNNSTDTVVRPLFTDSKEKRTLAIEGNADHITTSFYFTNNIGVDATVNKVYLDDNTYFTITSTTPSPVPFVLHPGDNLTAVVTYTATDHLVHHAHLLIDADHQIGATNSFDLQGFQVSGASVSNTLPSDVAITVSPNPATSFVNVAMSGVRNGNVEVYDMLGKSISTSASSTSWKWDASNAVAGSYIVRISGESLNGERFTTTKRVVVTK